jgi:hypothetical protein
MPSIGSIRLFRVLIFLSIFVAAPVFNVAHPAVLSLNRKEPGLSRGSPRNQTKAVVRLHSQDPHVVSQACSDLVDQEVKQATTEIRAVVLQSADPTVQANCALALGRLGSATEAAFLQGIATDAKWQPRVRSAALRANSLIAGADITYMTRLLADTDTSIRAAAAYVLCQGEVEAAVPGIREMFSSTDPETRRAALTAASLWPMAFTGDLTRVVTQNESSAPDKIEALSALDAVSDRLGQGDLQRLASVLTTQPKQGPEIAGATQQLLEDAGSESTTVLIPTADTANVELTWQSAASPSVQILQRRTLMLPLIVTVGLAGALPFLIAAIQLRAQRRNADSAFILMPSSLVTVAYLATWICSILLRSEDAVHSRLTVCFEMLSFGAIGSYLPNVAIMLRRAAQKDLTEAVFWSALSRVICALALSMLFCSMPWCPQHFCDAIALLLGGVTPFLLAVLIDRLRLPNSTGFAYGRDKPLEAVRGITRQQARRLREEGLLTVQHLATADWEHLIDRTPFSALTLLDWVDQAIALQELSLEQADRLSEAGIPISAIELAGLTPRAALSDGLPTTIARLLELPPDVLKLRAEILYNDPRLRKLARMREGFSKSSRESTSVKTA